MNITLYLYLIHKGKGCVMSFQESPIQQTLKNSEGKYTLGATISASFKMIFASWKVWILGFLAITLLGIALLAYIIFDFIGKVAVTMDESAYTGSSADQMPTLAMGIGAIVLSSISAIVCIFLLPFVYNAAYRGLHEQKIGWSDLFVGFPYGKVLLGLIIFNAATVLTSYIPFIGYIITIAITPFLLFLPIVPFEGKSFSYALNLSVRNYWKLLLLSIVTSLITIFLALTILGAVVGLPLGIIVYVVAYALLRYEETNQENTIY